MIRAGEDLCLYVRHYAWLGTAPDRAEGDKSKAPVRTRAQQMEFDAGGEFEPDMPDPGAAAYLLRHFWAAGPTVGDQALTHSELQHYQQGEGIRLTPWERDTLRCMSGAYLAASHQARDPSCPPPFAESTDAQRLRQAEHNRKMDLFLS